VPDDQGVPGHIYHRHDWEKGTLLELDELG
jgi:hypothetical protein